MRSSSHLTYSLTGCATEPRDGSARCQANTHSPRTSRRQGCDSSRSTAQPCTNSQTPTVSTLISHTQRRSSCSACPPAGVPSTVSENPTAGWQSSRTTPGGLTTRRLHSLHRGLRHRRAVKGIRYSLPSSNDAPPHPPPPPCPDHTAHSVRGGNRRHHYRTGAASEGSTPRAEGLHCPRQQTSDTVPYATFCRPWSLHR